ncbi:MAG: Trk system potassium transporter TrkA [Desulfofustis sp.]|jgi:trk system potassium uptake protein TrkA|nr:Trk system potassium transporter TrkA [Desulfofustis sp.]
MKILIYGTSEVAYMAAVRLSKEHDITLLDEQERIPERFGSLDLSYVSGSGADVISLEQAEVASMNLFIACSTRDEANIVACWTVKRIADIETICFVRTIELYNNLMFYSRGHYRAPYDIDTVIWPEQLLTQDIFRIVSVPEAIDVEYFAKGRAKLFEYRIKGDSMILDKRIMDCTFPENTLIVGITRENFLFIPDGSTVIRLDDKVIFMGTGVALDILAARFFQKSNKIKKVVLIGGGSVGFLLAEKLEQANIHITIIEHDKDRCLFLANNLHKALVLHGDGTDFELLESEAVGSADAIICVTNNDEKNLLCSLLVKQISKGRVIARVGNAQTAQLFDRVGIDVVVSPREAALKELMNRVQAHDIDILALIESGQGEVLRVTLPRDYATTKVVDLSFSASAIIGAIQRGRQIIIPRGETTIKGGDLLIIFTMAADAEAIKKMFVTP